MERSRKKAVVHAIPIESKTVAFLSTPFFLLKKSRKMPSLILRVGIFSCLTRLSTRAVESWFQGGSRNQAGSATGCEPQLFSFASRVGFDGRDADCGQPRRCRAISRHCVD